MDHSFSSGHSLVHQVVGAKMLELSYLLCPYLVIINSQCIVHLSILLHISIFYQYDKLQLIDCCRFFYLFFIDEIRPLIGKS